MGSGFKKRLETYKYHNADADPDPGSLITIREKVYNKNSKQLLKTKNQYTGISLNAPL